MGPDTWLSETVQNILHIPIYGALGFLAFWAVSAWIERTGLQAWTAFLISAVYGVLDEVHQSTVPGRFGSIADVGLDLIGIIGGLAAFALFRQRETHTT